MSIDAFTDDQIREIYANSINISEMAQKLGYSALSGGNTHARIKRKLEALGNPMDVAT